MKEFSNKRGQAAMEFLMTYGWAILVVLVVIGALAYFGVLSPATLLPEKCTFPVSISCTDHRVSATDQTLVLQNGAGRDMIVREIILTGDALGTQGQTYPATCQPSCRLSTGARYSSSVTLRNGASASFTIATDDDIGSACPVADGCDYRDTGRDKNRYNVTVFYSWQDSAGITHQAPGELLARRT